MYSLPLSSAFSKFHESITISNVNVVVFPFHTLDCSFLYWVIDRYLNGSLLPKIDSNNPFGGLQVFYKHSDFSS